MLDSSSKLPFHVLLLTQKGNLREPENTKNCGSEEKLKKCCASVRRRTPLVSLRDSKIMGVFDARCMLSQILPGKAICIKFLGYIAGGQT